ncbi:hypothetical protein I858_005785 [Planococcus versutus]|uniref:Lipoprotein n=1 Tax=Planococcus versutus TaxID=1302659 RepID=A0A1B1S012_9BACL|nr:hypothetical protein I858_005785 [Planococcus versutus]
MKGFLSLLSIILIASACGLILLTFYGNPLEKAINRESMYAYIETRENNTLEIPEKNQVTTKIPEQAAFTTTAYQAIESSCFSVSSEE